MLNRALRPMLPGRIGAPLCAPIGTVANEPRFRYFNVSLKLANSGLPPIPPRLRAVVEGLQALRGIAQITAVTIVSEIGSFSRFEPRKLMGYSGLVSSEHSSGSRIRRGG